MKANNTTARKPTAVFTVWEYKTGKQVRQVRLYCDPIEFIEKLRAHRPGEAATRYNRDIPGYEGVFTPQEDRFAPFAYRFELGLL